MINKHIEQKTFTTFTFFLTFKTTFIKEIFFD